MFKIKDTTISCIRVYQKLFSPDQGLIRYIFRTKSRCVMYPSCSEYMIIAIDKFGVLYGVWKGMRRIFRCNPWQKRLIDAP